MADRCWRCRAENTQCSTRDPHSSCRAHISSQTFAGSHAGSGKGDSDVYTTLETRWKKKRKDREKEGGVRLVLKGHSAVLPPVRQHDIPTLPKHVLDGGERHSGRDDYAAAQELDDVLWLGLVHGRKAVQRRRRRQTRCPSLGRRLGSGSRRREGDGSRSRHAYSQSIHDLLKSESQRPGCQTEKPHRGHRLDLRRPRSCELSATGWPTVGCFCEGKKAGSCSDQSSNET